MSNIDEDGHRENFVQLQVDECKADSQAQEQRPMVTCEQLKDDVEHWHDVARVSYSPLNSALETMDALLAALVATTPDPLLVKVRELIKPYIFSDCGDRNNDGVMEAIALIDAMGGGNVQQ